ncbi:alpha/beta hydrolase [Amycolatopsis sp. SID8362]|uniref:alpha/beta hydrolase n=1 Tax=Amycolatopsis sp. SID8362 TaxID=2690346 RepID=UPI00136F85F9|nr:alpha/beta hydrolase [Amycolatopsis sp. SID8362]NBH12051.1 alpha/beta hydrolase fold domain-containing protein [Amycolatopsis sp. SID8362]NED48742.1 alpha/beta hydrolase [Amycolatopsis sp. SID8362]
MTTQIPLCWARLDSHAFLAAQAIAAALPAPVRELGAETARKVLASPPADVPLTPLARVEDLAVPTRAGRLRARRYHAPATPGGVLLYLHGGGFVLGTLDGVDEACRAIAARSGWDVVSLEYRLAPEHPYPAALEDAIDTFTWLREHDDRVAVGGDSAGGNLAAALCLHLRDHDLTPPVTQILVYPAVDDRFATPSWTEFADAPLLTTADARWLWAQYTGSAVIDEYAAPMKAASLRGLPPALVLTAEVDPLRDDAEAYAARLRADGVPSTVVRHTGVFHGFFTEVGVFAQTDTALDDVARHLRAH